MFWKKKKMTVPCSRCGKKEVVATTFDARTNKHEELCFDCYIKYFRELESMKTCKKCFFFHENFCRKIELKLEHKVRCTGPATNYVCLYYPQAKECVHYITKEEYEKKAVRGEISAAPTIEIIHKGAVGIFDFNSLAAMLANKGLVLQVVECPHCSGNVDFPERGNITKCEYCGKDIYVTDILEKFKSIIGVE